MMRIVGGAFRVWHARAGRVLAYAERHNDLLDVTKPYMADLLRGKLPALSVMAIGTSGTAVSPGDVALLAEIARIALPAPDTDTATARNVRIGNAAYLRVRFTGVNATIREAALVGGLVSPPGALGAGAYWDRVLVGPFTIVPAETLTLEATLLFG